MSSKQQSYDKTYSNLDTELRAIDVLLHEDQRFHVVDLPKHLGTVKIGQALA